MKVREIIALAETLLCPGDAEAWDAYGLQTGDREADVSRVLVSLDVTRATLEEAAARGCGLIMAHHPVLFHPTREIVAHAGTGDVIFRAIQLGIGIYCAHTPLDKAAAGTGYALAEALDLSEIRRPGGSGYLSVGIMPVGGENFAAYTMGKLGLPCIRTIGQPGGGNLAAMVPGSGAEFAAEAAEAGASVFVTGEVKYHDALALADLPLQTVEIGHDFSEIPGVIRWAKDLQKAADMVSCHCAFLCAGTRAQPYTWLQDERKHV